MRGNFWTYRKRPTREEIEEERKKELKRLVEKYGSELVPDYVLPIHREEVIGKTIEWGKYWKVVEYRVRFAEEDTVVLTGLKVVARRTPRGYRCL